MPWPSEQRLAALLRYRASHDEDFAPFPIRDKKFEQIAFYLSIQDRAKITADMMLEVFSVPKEKKEEYGPILARFITYIKSISPDSWPHYIQYLRENSGSLHMELIPQVAEASDLETDAKINAKMSAVLDEWLKTPAPQTVDDFLVKVIVADMQTAGLSLSSGPGVLSAFAETYMSEEVKADPILNAKFKTEFLKKIQPARDSLPPSGE